MALRPEHLLSLYPALFWEVRELADGVQGSLFPGEEDMENWLFGESTMSALLTFQVCIAWSAESPLNHGHQLMSS